MPTGKGPTTPAATPTPAPSGETAVPAPRAGKPRAPPGLPLGRAPGEPAPPPSGPIEADLLDPDGVPEPPFRLPSFRAAALFLVMMVLVSAVVYPGAVTLVAQALFPVDPAHVATMIGENISNPALFWLRPSMIDWQPYTGAGGENPYGPVSGALRNTTLHYIREYGLLNTTVPLDLVSPSYSGLDPDLYPDAVLIQIPRVAHFSNVSSSTLWSLVNASLVQPQAGFIGPDYVNVVQLDQALLQQPQLAGAWV